MDTDGIRMIGGKFGVLRKLGHGAMGEVLLCQSREGGNVAIKLLTETKISGIDRFKTEFAILKELSHPGINRVYDFGLDEDTGLYYFSTEYIDGTGFLDATDDLGVEGIEELFIQVLRALEYLHGHGIMHTDIKAANVLVEQLDDGLKAKLIDFGLAALGPPDKIVGTPSHMAPEIILKNSPDRRADLYSLGVLIYSALAKFNPFKAGDVSEALHRQLNLMPAPPSEHNRRVPTYLDDIVLKLLRKNPSERYPSAAHVIRALSYGSGKDYPVETKETFLGYIPTEGNLVGRKGEMAEARKLCEAARAGETGEPFVLCVTGSVGSGRKRLLKELRYSAQLNEMRTAVLAAIDDASLARFAEELERIAAHPTQPTLVSCHVMGLISVKRSAAHIVDSLSRMIKTMKTATAIAPPEGRPRWLFAFTAQPDELPFLLNLLGIDHGRGEVRVIKLGNFAISETSEYLKTMTGTEEVPDELVNEIFRRTQGNPLFITEFMKEIVEKGMLFDRAGRWNREAIEDIGLHFGDVKVPGTLSGIFDRSYRNTLPEERRMLEFLAVWHRPATLSEIGTLARVDDPRKTLSSLAKSGLVQFDAQQAIYSIDNAMLREIVYERMDEETRHSLHRAIVERLTDSRPDAIEEIKWHTGKSSDDDAAIDALIELGLIHLDRSRPFEATSVLIEAVRPARTSGHRLCEILLHLGEAYVMSLNYAAALDTFGMLLGLQEDRGATPEDIANTLQKIGVTQLRDGRIDDAKGNLSRAKNILLDAKGSEAGLLRIENLIARTAFLEGRLKDAERIYTDTKKRWERLPDGDKALVLNNDLAHVLLQMGQLDQAREALDADIEYLEEIGADVELERAYYAAAELLRRRGEIDAAVEKFEKAIEIAKRISDSELLLRAYNGLGNLFSDKEAPERSLYWYQRGLDLAIRTGEDATAAAIAVNIGLIKSKEGKVDEALADFRSAVDIFKQADRKSSLDQCYLFRAYMELADIYRNEGDYAKTDHYVSEAERIARAQPDLADEIFWVKRMRYRLASDQGEVMTANRLLRELEREADTDEKREETTRLTGETREEVSILDVGVDADEEEVETMGQKQYRYILEINKYLSGETELDFVLKTILKYALELSGAQAGFVLLGKGGEFEIGAGYNVESGGEISEVGQSIARMAIANDRIVVTNDAVSDERFNSIDSVVALGLKSVACIPIHARKETIGALYIENRERPGAFDGMNEEVLGTFADQAGIAIQNARLLEKYDKAQQELRRRVDESSVRMERLDAQVKSQASELAGRYRFDKLTSVNARMREIFELLSRISPTELSVCISGESGTGKELVAKAIHFASSRSKGSFVAINCGAIPATLIEAELFGHKAGAFTGATRDRAGLFEAANGGTIFLDEIAELDVSLQAKLLRVLQEREVTRVGDSKPVACDVRVISATNRNLAGSIEDGSFRKDLYYRICEIGVDLPPLRGRLEDIPTLAEEFVKEYCEQHKVKDAPSIDPPFLRRLMSYDWPGNIRELQNTIRVATALAEKGRITLASLPEGHALASVKTVREPERKTAKDTSDLPMIDKRNRFDSAKGWKDYEAEIIAAALRDAEMNAKETAKHLGIAIATVYKKVSELGLKDDSNPLLSTPFRYDPKITLEEYRTRIFKAAWEEAGEKPYPAAKALSVSPGFFYKVMKGF